MSEDEKAPKRRVQSTTDRDLDYHLRRRAASHHDTDQDTVHGEFETTTPPEVHEEITRPHDVTVMQRYQNDVAYRVLWDRLGDFKAQVRHTHTVIADQTMAAHQAAQSGANQALIERIDEAEEWLHRQDTVMRLIKWIGVALATAFLASIITVGTKIFTWGVSDGELNIRIQRIEHDIQTLQHDTRNLAREPEWMKYLPAQTKGTQP